MRLNDTSVWHNGAGPDGDVVVSSRTRLARNIAGFPFVSSASAAQRQEVIRMAQRANWPDDLSASLVWVNLQQATPLDRTLLVERHLISKQFADGDQPRSVAITHDECLSVMVNEEDHLRMQVLHGGMRLRECFERVEALDLALERSLDFAFLPRWGYLTACPTNVGCGIRFSVMLHLPALKLTNELDKVRRAAKDMHLAVRGFYGEGSEAVGDFYQVSNQITLGRSETDLFDHFAHCIVPNLVEYERTARSVLLNQSRPLVDDRVHRALATLRSARLLSADEGMKLLSRVRLGICLGRLNEIDLATVHRLILQIQPAHLKVLTSPDECDPELRESRATLVRRTLGAP